VTSQRDAKPWDEMDDDEHAEAGHYQCPDCGTWHDGMTTGTEWCADCADDTGEAETTS
jgi:uncharacterized protein (DUF983 family)